MAILVYRSVAEKRPPPLPCSSCKFPRTLSNARFPATKKKGWCFPLQKPGKTLHEFKPMSPHADFFLLEEFPPILLMEEFPNNHLGCIKPVVNHGINCQPQLVSRISSINSTVSPTPPLWSEGKGSKSCLYTVCCAGFLTTEVLHRNHKVWPNYNISPTWIFLK